MSIEINFEALEQLSIADLTCLITHFREQRRWITIDFSREDTYNYDYKRNKDCDTACHEELNKRLNNIFIY